MEHDEIELERQETMVRVLSPEIANRYGPGSHGAYEALDRTYVAMETFDFAIKQHPLVLLDHDLYHHAHAIMEAMQELYAEIAQKVE